MFARVLPPPANIMFVLDDSGSMNFDVMVRGGYDGTFNPQDPSTQGYCYIFDDLGDNTYSESWRYAGKENRTYWRTQYHGTNVVYYNPQVAYSPWPSYIGATYAPADPDKPRSHPDNSSITLNLSGASYTIGPVEVPHARYVLYDSVSGRKYLVVLNGAKNYYEISTEISGREEKISALTLIPDIPAGLDSGRTYAAERQNFANWFTYHRRREFVAKNALAQIIKNLSEVRVGIYGINGRIIQPLAEVNVSTEGAGTSDSTADLLQKLYAFKSNGGTPLKKGLKTVGTYFAANTGTLAGVPGPKPYGIVEEGGSCQQSFTIILTDGFYSDLDTTHFGDTDGDSHPNTLADIAMYYYHTDLNQDLPDQVPQTRHSKARHQHMTTYAVAFGVSGTLNPDDYDADLTHKQTGKPIVWPQVTKDRSPETIDDLWHAAVNGRGQFFNAHSPVELIDALNRLMDAIQEILIASSSSVTVSGHYLYAKAGPDTLLYQALYSNRNDEWTGDILAFPVDPVTGELRKSDSRAWSAAAKLEARDANDRLIATYNGAAGKPFRVSELTDSQRDALGANPGDAVAYLRGAEVSGLRLRSQKLGDIVNSAPVFAEGVVYAGGNDGMLHAFDALSGEELFAYVPNLVFAHLSHLTDPGYTHRFYVDSTPTIKSGDLIGGTPDVPKTLLVGGLRKGGKGYFALDVTAAKSRITAEAALAERVLWEFPQSADPDMGYSFSRPVIVKTNSTRHPWAVVFGNGYASASGVSALYILNPLDGALIRKITAGKGPDNGMSSPVAVDVSNDQKADFVYAGDLHGNLWKFDLTSDDAGRWEAAFSKDFEPQPLFSARGPGGSPQPITTRPDVMHHPRQHGYIVCFGTGKYVSDNDPADMTVQTIYGIWDYGDLVYDLRARKWSLDDPLEFLGEFRRGSTPELSNQPAAVTLLQQTLTDLTVTLRGEEKDIRLLSDEKPIWATLPDPDDALGQKPDPSRLETNHAGFYLDLKPGERVISDVSIRDRLLLAVGFTPTSDRCGPGGNSMFMAINAFTGGYAGGGVFDISGDRRVDVDDYLDIDITGIVGRRAPAGVGFYGNLQTPAILRLHGSDGMYLSSSSGEIPLLHARPARLGIAYWMEMSF
jgi:type IV pilus assembly protein PilY1